jgi:hypothetical protein
MKSLRRSRPRDFAESIGDVMRRMPLRKFLEGGHFSPERGAYLSAEKIEAALESFSPPGLQGAKIQRE